LDGVKIVSLEHGNAAPAATCYLADWGADVIKIEPVIRDRGDGGGSKIELGGVEVDPAVEFRDRNKRSLAVDLKKGAGRDILCQLLKKADVFVTNIQQDSVKRLGFDYDTLRQLNAGLIYAILTGYGTQGPDKDEPATDRAAVWARTGAHYLMTEPGSVPPEHPYAMGDFTASVHVVAGVSAALFRREKTGLGEELVFSLYHCGMWNIGVPVQWALSGVKRNRASARGGTSNPLHIRYLTKDQRWLAFQMSNPDLYWPVFCETIERPELESDPRFHNAKARSENSAELIRILDEVFATRTLAEWNKLCRKNHLIFAPIQSLEEAITDPQALANDFFVDLA
ncbi:MAG: CoA transferase, partial [Dehalococcoidales bacterium]|nr:CoA transferase [Dehalococcoidales bacterium]